MCKACAKTFEKVCCTIPANCKTSVIYPFIPVNENVTFEVIQRRVTDTILNLLFISQGTYFYAKGGLEVIDAYKILRARQNSVKLHIITSLKDVDHQIINMCNQTEGISISDFKYSFEEMKQIYANSHILLHPTSQDSFPLTILEAIKAGLPVIGTALFAIPEMVVDGYNGYLTEPHYWFFDKSNIPNPAIWNHRKSTIYSGKISSRIVDFLVDKISLLYNDRALLQRLSINSFGTIRFRLATCVFAENSRKSIR